MLHRSAIVNYISTMLSFISFVSSHMKFPFNLKLCSPFLFSLIFLCFCSECNIHPPYLCVATSIVVTSNIGMKRRFVHQHIKSSNIYLQSFSKPKERYYNLQISLSHSSLIFPKTSSKLIYRFSIVVVYCFSIVGAKIQSLNACVLSRFSLPQ